MNTGIVSGELAPKDTFTAEHFGSAASVAGLAPSDHVAQTDFNAPLIGRLILLPATHIKPNQPLVNDTTGKIEIVTKDKFFSRNDYSRYYLVTEEQITPKNLVCFEEDDLFEADIRMADKIFPGKEQMYKVCYPAANSIVERLHNMYYNTVKEKKDEYIRFTKIHGDKYAGFPLPADKAARISAHEANERWSFIFNYVLKTQPTPMAKKRIGVLFGTIAGADPANISTIKVLEKYRSWIIS